MGASLTGPARHHQALATSAAACQASLKREERPRCRPHGAWLNHRTDGHCRRSSRPNCPLLSGLLAALLAAGTAPVLGYVTVVEAHLLAGPSESSPPGRTSPEPGHHRSS